MSYEAPKITDYGDLLELTAAGAGGNVEDGAGKQVQIDANPITQVTVQLLP